jgi:hypothetical protein
MVGAHRIFTFLCIYSVLAQELQTIRQMLNSDCIQTIYTHEDIEMIIVNDLEMNLELDREALEDLTGGKKGYGYGYKHKKHYYKKYRRPYYFKKARYFDYYESYYRPHKKYGYTPKFNYGYGCNPW